MVFIGKFLKGFLNGQLDLLRRVELLVVRKIFLEEGMKAAYNQAIKVGNFEVAKRVFELAVAE